MEVKVDQTTEVMDDLKGAAPIVIVDEEEKVILRKIDTQ
jgi:hypothetical protein